MKNFVFYHCTPVNDYILRFQSTWNKILQSKLYDRIDTFFYLMNGNAKCPIEDPKVVCYNFDGWKNEGISANFVRNFCINNEDCNILYIHNKGVTKPNNYNISKWIEFLEYFVITKHEECIKNLKFYDTCSSNLKLHPFIHYSGNLWWAKSNHIKNLNLCDEEDYLGCEKWPLSKGDVNKFYNFFTTHKNLYEEIIYEHEYKRD